VGHDSRQPLGLLGMSPVVCPVGGEAVTSPGAVYRCEAAGQSRLSDALPSSPKTGCCYQECLLESLDALLVALAFFAPKDRGALLAITRLSGVLTRNQFPGGQALGRGLKDLAKMLTMFRALRQGGYGSRLNVSVARGAACVAAASG
jgi:hypothetical protein